MKLNFLNIMLIITFILLFLPAFAFPMMLGSFCLMYFFIFLILYLGLLFLFNNKYLLKNINTFIKYKCVKILILYFIIETIISVFFFVLGKSSISVLICSIPLRIVWYIFPLFVSFIFAKQMRLKTLIKFIYLLILGIYLYGIFGFIAYYFDVDILKSIYNFFNNSRLLKKNLTELGTFSGIFPRVRSVFEEPCHLGAFIVALLPMIYKLSFNKYKIFNNNFLNKFVKMLIPILTWLIILGTQSPIYLVIAIAVTLLYWLIINTKTNTATKLIIFCVSTLTFILFILIIMLIDEQVIADTFLMRIRKVISSIQHIDDLIMSEKSLGRRIIDANCMIQIFKRNPLFGCGIGNLADVLPIELHRTSLPIVNEIFKALEKSNRYSATPNIFFSQLATTGLVGVILLYSFFISVVVQVNNALKYTSGMLYDFLFGLKYFITLYIVLSFYDSQLTFPYGFTLMGVSLGVVYKINRKNFLENKRRLNEKVLD